MEAKTENTQDIGVSTNQARLKLKTVVEFQLKCADITETKRPSFLGLLNDQVWGGKLHVWLNWMWLCSSISLFIGYAVKEKRDAIDLVEPSAVIIAVVLNMAVQIRKAQHQATEVYKRFVRIWKAFVAQHPSEFGQHPQDSQPFLANAVLQQGSPLVSIVPAYRDGRWQRLPALLLVEGDIIALMAGDIAPGRARYLASGKSKNEGSAKWLNAEEVVERGQRVTVRIPVYSTPRASRQMKVDPMSESLLEHCGDLRCYRLEETPLISTLRQALNPPDLPPPLLHKRMGVVLKLWPWAAAAAIALSLVGGTLRTGLHFQIYGVDELVSSFLLNPARCCILVLPPWVPLALFLGEVLATARLLALASSLFLTWKNSHRMNKLTHRELSYQVVATTPSDIEDDLDVDERQENLSRNRIELSRKLFLKYAKATFRDRLGFELPPPRPPTPSQIPSPGTYSLVVTEDREYCDTESPPTRSAWRLFKYRKCKRKKTDIDIHFAVPLMRSCFVQRLGAATMVCVLDEDVVCDPESEPEEIFLLGTDEQGAPCSNHVLDLHTLPDKEGPESTAFEDPNWWSYLSHLKPIGLACMLTGVSSQESLEQGQGNQQNLATASVKNEKPLVVYSDLVHHIRHHIPQGFLLQVAQAIGFRESDTEYLAPRKQLQVLSPRLADARLTEDLHAQGQHETRHRGLLNPHMRSVVVEDRDQKSMQLMAQGNPALVVGMCKDYWDGTAIAPLRQTTRSAILDMYQQWSLEDLEVIAFCYTPVPYNLQSYLTIAGKAVANTHGVSLPDYFIEDQMCYDSTLRTLNSASLAKPGATGIQRVPIEGKMRPIHKVETEMRLEFPFISEEQFEEPPFLPGSGEEISGEEDGSERNTMSLHDLNVLECDSTRSSLAGDERKQSIAEVSSAKLSSSTRSQVFEDQGADLDTDASTASIHYKSSPSLINHSQIRFELPRPILNQYSDIISADESEVKIEMTKPPGKATISRTPSTFGVGEMASLNEHGSTDSKAEYGADSAGGVRSGKIRIGRVPKAQIGSRSQSARVPARRMSLDDSGLPTSSGMTNSRADVALWNLLREQVFLGMVASSIPPKNDVPQLVEDLDAAGIRFVYFSPRNMRRSKLLVEKMGIETDWNCAISLRPLDEPHTPDPHRMKSKYADWDVKARLPHGIDAIREHLKQVDNVPLLVSLFTDATAESTCQMIEVFKENREITLGLGTLFRSPNAELFNSADIAIGMDLLPGSQATASLPLQHPRQLDQADLQFVRSVIGLHCALMLSPPVTSEGNVNEEYPVTLLLDLVREGRKLLQNMYQALIFAGLSYLTLALLEILSCFSPFLVRPSLNGAQWVWLGLVNIPGLAFPLLASNADKDVMSRTPEKNKDDSQLAGRHYWYALLATLPAVGSCMVTFFWTLSSLLVSKEGELVQSCCGCEDPASSPWHLVFLCKELIDDSSSATIGLLVQISQSLMMAHLTLFLCLFSGLVTSIISPCFLSNCHRNWLWICAVICISCLQVAYCALDVIIFSLPLDEARKLHWGSILAFVFFSLLLTCVIIECLKLHNTHIHKRYLMFLRLEFETRLGMHSPK